MLMTIDDIAEVLQVSRHYVRDILTKRPDFPAPRVEFSQKLRRWAREDVDRWVSRQTPQKTPQTA